MITLLICLTVPVDYRSFMLGQFWPLAMAEMIATAGFIRLIAKGGR